MWVYYNTLKHITKMIILLTIDTIIYISGKYNKKIRIINERSILYSCSPVIEGRKTKIYKIIHQHSYYYNVLYSVIKSFKCSSISEENYRNQENDL